jgi:TonB family protein
MVALSCGLHVAAFLVALGADSLHRRKVLTEQVAVVDLVGLPGPSEEPSPSPPATEESPAPPPPAAKEREAAPPPKAAPERTPAPPPKAASAPPAAPSPKGPPSAAAARTSPDGLLPPSRPAPVEKAPEKAPPPDVRSAEEAIRAMRERREQSERVRDIVARRKMESAAASAIVGVRQRARRQVDLTGVRPGAGRNGAASPGGGSGSAGNVRATMEQVIYFRALRDRIRSKWIAPPGDTSSLMVKMVVTIEKDGSVSNTVVEKGSGNRLFDDSVQRAIGKASPLPVPPEQLRGGEECYSVGFNFKVGEE